MDLLISNWKEALASLGALVVVATQLLGLIKLYRENRQLKEALAAGKQQIQVATFEQIERFTRKDEPNRRQKLWAFEGSGLVAVGALFSNLAPAVMYILAAALAAFVVIVIAQIRADGEQKQLVAAVRERMGAAT